MFRLQIAIVAALLVLAPCLAHAQEDYGRSSHQPRSQHDIIRDRAIACKGLKGPALAECLDNYVGPSERGGWRRPASPQRKQGRA